VFILKIILENSSNEEILQVKVLEIILLMMNPDTIYFTDSLIENVNFGYYCLNYLINYEGFDYVP